MQMGGKDNKNQLPLIIGLIVIIAIAAGAAFFMYAGGSGGADDASAQIDTATQQTPSSETTALSDQSAGTNAVGVTPVEGSNAVDSEAQSQQTEQVDPNALFKDKAPTDLWRADPFAPAGYVEQKGKKPVLHKKLDVPTMGRLFASKPKSREDYSASLLPPPAVRVAGILYGQRVNALIQTPDGWRTVKPGDKLRDGTVIHQIEKDRIVLRTADVKPRFIEVKLAASMIPAAQSAPSSGSNPSGLYGGQSGFDDHAM